MPVGQITVKEAETMDQNTRQIHKRGLPESVVSRISYSPPETTQGRTHKNTDTSHWNENKILEPAGNRTQLEGRDSTDHGIQ